MFVDRAVIQVHGGTGGSGAEAFRREKGVPRGGPSGGDGGEGGSVVLVGDSHLTTLLDLTRRPLIKAERGQHGEGSNKTGRSGADAEIRVPLGTVARDADSGELLGELLGNGDRLVVARGGRGGRGNARFTTPTRQAPRRWEPGEEGEERRVELELKLIADVGLVGQPNAGKSTLLKAVSRAHPKIADYPFTTLTPNLGVAELPDYRTLVLADIPGIVEGAHQGKGLGLQFLRHIERTRVLAFLVPLDAEDPQGVYDELREEVRSYSGEMARAPHCLVLSKRDLIGSVEAIPSVEAPDAWGVFPISAVTGGGLSELLEALYARVRRAEAEGEEEADGEEAWWVPE